MAKKDTVEITIEALDNMISYMRELIFKYKDADADLATYPFEVGFLDYLISVKTKLKNEVRNVKNKRSKED
jgi:hypothetical protein